MYFLTPVIDSVRGFRRRCANESGTFFSEVTGMAGRPKQITGFQTRTTPVLLNFQDVAVISSHSMP